MTDESERKGCEWLAIKAGVNPADVIRVTHLLIRERAAVRDEAQAEIARLKAELAYARSPEGRAPF